MPGRADVSNFDIFIATAPGLESVLADEVRDAGLKVSDTTSGGVTVRGGWPDVWCANFELRCANRVLARIATFRAAHLADLERLARQVPWSAYLRRDRSFGVEAVCRKSKIYHSGAAEERVASAITGTLGARASDTPDVWVMVRIEADEVTVSLDTSGALLHRRGFKEAVNKAPMRETMAAALLRACGYRSQETVLDPMCGSGTFVIEAAEMALGLAPGRARRFAFEDLATFEAEGWRAVRAGVRPIRSAVCAFGSDRDAGAIGLSRANAERAGVLDRVSFVKATVAECARPDGPPGLVIVNPPYGERIGDRHKLLPVYRALGTTMTLRFRGWRIGIVATDVELVKAMGLPLKKSEAPIAHGGLRVWLWQGGPLGS